MKRIFYFLFLFLQFAWGQKEILIKNIDTENFPEVFLTFKYYYPQKIDAKEIKIIENNTEIIPEIISVIPDSSSDEKLNVLILFEDMASRPQQTAFYKKILSETLPQASPNLRYNIAIFDRARDGRKLLRFFFSDFLPAESILQKLPAYQTTRDRWSLQKSSELYLALDKGLNFLASRYANQNNIIILFSAGYNLSASNSVSLESILQKSKQKQIPIYVLQYFHYEHRSLEKLAKDTYGLFEFTKNPIQGKYALKKFLNKALPRLKGFNYKISYYTTFKKNGKQHTSILKVQNASENFYLQSPCNSLCFIKRNWLVFSILLLLIIGIAVGITFWYKGKQPERIIERVEKVIIKEPEEIKRKEFPLPKPASPETIRRAFNGSFPFLRQESSGKTFYLNISPLIFGRGSQAHIRIDDSLISRKHALLFFDEQKQQFFIVDLASVNGTEINGKRIESDRPYLLKDRDVITFAKEHNYTYSL